MSGTPRDGDAGWLRYEGDESADRASSEPASTDPTTDSAATDRGATDPGASDSGATDSAATDAATADQRVAPAAATDAAWLRHDLPDPSAADATEHPGAAAPGTAHSSDSPWLPAELEVARSARTPSTPQAHDTGVPPTLVAGAEEETPSHVSSATRPLPAVADAEDHERPVDDEEEPVGGLAVLGAAIKEFAIVVGMALVLSFIVKTWLLQAFYIPSGSMEDTLVLNDRVIVSKLTPGPIDLKRGDIIVFADPGQWLDEAPPAKQGPVATIVTETLTFVGLLPDNSENHLIKRVIGLPGDHVVCCDEGGRITINGSAIKEPYLKPGDAASEQDFDITVPSGRVWVMGDHRSNSADSRAHDAPQNNGSQGSVDERLIVGRAVALVWPLDHLTWLSNPTSTFAKVPAPSAGSGSAPQGTGGTGQGEGGGEVGGTDTPTGSG